MCSNLNNDRGRLLHHHGLSLHHHGLRLHHHGLRLHHHGLLSDVHLSRSGGDLLGCICRLLAAAVAAEADQNDDENNTTNNATNNSTEHVFGRSNAVVKKICSVSESSRANIGLRIVVLFCVTAILPT